MQAPWGACRLRPPTTAHLLVLVIITLLLARTQAQCSRTLSREARTIIEKQIVPQAKAVSYKLPTDCPLHSSRDRYLFQDDHANKKRSLWSCGFCHKQFRTRGYLDQHFDRKHMHDVDDNAHDCFAALCPMLGCESFDASSNYVDEASFSFMCEATLHKCFPPHAPPEVRHLRDSLSRSLCQGQRTQSTNHVLYWTLVALTLIVCAAFVVVLLVQRAEGATAQDLRPLRARLYHAVNTKPRWWWQRLWKRKERRHTF